MRMARLLGVAAALAVISLVSIGFGFWMARIAGTANQLAVQLPVAILVGVAGMVGGLHILRPRYGLNPAQEFVPTLLLAFPVSGLLVVGVHYLVTGYLTAFGNVMGAWFVLFVEAVIALPIAAAAGHRRGDAEGRVHSQ